MRSLQHAGGGRPGGTTRTAPSAGRAPAHPAAAGGRPERAAAGLVTADGGNVAAVMR